MAVRSIKIDKLSEAFDAFEQSLNGEKKSNLHALRKQSYERVLENGLPSNKSEEYKYTNIARYFSREFEYNNSPVSEEILNREIKPLIRTHGDVNRMVFVNGRFSREHSDLIEESKIKILDLETGYRKFPAEIERHFNGVNPEFQDGFSDLNTTFAKSGTFIHVEKGVVVEKPVILYFIKDTTRGKVVTSPRNLFLIGENSQVKITEFYHTFGDKESYTNTVTEVKIAKNAVVDLYKIEPDRASAYHVGNTNIIQGDNSVLNSVTITLGGTMIRNNLNIALDGEYCESNMYGLSILRDRQHADNQTVVDHLQPNSYSNELYKNILDNESTGVFNGRIYVRQYAQKTNAFQSNRNILLSEDASINTKPQLEIWADDVKCSHGATTGQIDQDQLFYLRARGLSEESARAMLLYAFAKDVLDNIKVDSIRESLDVIISERLHKNF
jgi:Fe-S cluster assembly protein SufD